MDVGEIEAVAGGDIYLVETGMFDVSGYGGAYVVDAERPAIVETGIGTNHDKLLGALDEVGLAPADVERIVVTHVHLDHAGGAGFLAHACPNATVFAHEIGAPHLVSPEKLIEGTKQAVGDQWRYYAEPEPIPSDRVEAIEEGDRIDLGDRSLEPHHAPGHAPHQVILHVPEMDVVFTGDAAGIWVPELEAVYPTAPPPQFDLDQAVADLETIASLEPRTLLYTHFGPVSYSRELLDRYERTLAGWVRDVDEAATEFDDEAAIVEAFMQGSELIGVWGGRKARGEIALNVSGALDYLRRIRGED